MVIIHINSPERHPELSFLASVKFIRKFSYSPCHLNHPILNRCPDFLWQVITPVRRKVILAMALAGWRHYTSPGAPFLAWSLRDIRATPDAIPAAAAGGVIGCVVLTFVLRLQAFNTSHYAAFHLRTFCAAG